MRAEDMTADWRTDTQNRAVRHRFDPLQMPLSPRCWGPPPASGPGGEP